MSYLRRIVTMALVSILFSRGALDTAGGETAAASPIRSSPSSCNRAAFRVIVDVGHTVDRHGVLSARGTTEYRFNLRLANRIEQMLVDAGFGKTVELITAAPPPRGLFERAARANDVRADLFLSIHHDGVPDVRFGRLLGNQLKARGLQYTPHYAEKFMGNRQRKLVDAEAGVYRYDQLIVLRSTRMPAVLLEAGSIVNRDEELLLESPERQAAIAAAVTDAVEAFCVARAPRKPARAARRPGV